MLSPWRSELLKRLQSIILASLLSCKCMVGVQWNVCWLNAYIGKAFKSQGYQQKTINQKTVFLCPLKNNGHLRNVLKSNSKLFSWASLVAQWLRICLPMQGTPVWSLAWEDPTCRGATKPVCYNYWACALEPASHNCWTCMPQLLKPACLEPMLRNKRSHRNEKPAYCNEE